MTEKHIYVYIHRYTADAGTAHDPIKPNTPTSTGDDAEEVSGSFRNDPGVEDAAGCDCSKGADFMTADLVKGRRDLKHLRKRFKTFQSHK